jgi:ubiquinone/menaquinone biosynthesis C-methylase UbiE
MSAWRKKMGTIQAPAEDQVEKGTDSAATRTAQRRYDRQAAIYDLIDVPSERLFFRRWRERLWSLLPGGRVLEVGVGTGKNLPFHGARLDVTAVDLSPKMMRRAEGRRRRIGGRAALALMDAQVLALTDSSFDAVASTFVFCSVPDPVRSLSEVRRVLRPGGRAILLEHVRSRNRLVGWLMDRLNPLVVRLGGVNINRDTVGNVERASLRVLKVTDLRFGIFKLIEAER